MALVEDVVSIVVIILIFIVAGIVFVNKYSGIIVQKESFWSQRLLEDKYSSAFNALLLVTEPNSKRSFGDLIGSAAYYRTDYVSTKNRRVNVEESFKELLDKSFQNYYFETSAGIDSVHLVFIMDGSNSTKDESEYLARNSQFIMQSVNKSLDIPGMGITSEVYILQESNDSWCMNYTIPCTYLGYSDIYFNQTYDTFDLRKHRYSLFKPFHFTEEEEVWKSDWQTAMSALALMRSDDDLRVVTVMLPVTDSLSSSTELLFPCPIDYVYSIISRDNDIMRRFNYVVNPIFNANIDPAAFCDERVVQMMTALAAGTNGVVIVSRDNFATRIGPSLKKNFESMQITVGKKKSGKSYSISRKLPMPDGSLAEGRFYIYLD
ncbi:MAG: hypothetical protein ABIF10_01870 [Candidatus Woesearchaeota archaeon]